MSQPNKPEIYLALDGYRFLAAACVVLYHYDADFQLGLGKLFPAIGRLPVMVDFFFMLSGFVIAVNYFDRLCTAQDYARFLRARLARIYPLHLLTLLAMAALAGAALLADLPVNHPEILGFDGFPANLALLHAWGVLDHPSFNVPSWSISAEWFVYLLTPLFLWMARHLPLSANALSILLFAAATAVLRHWLGLGDWLNATFDFGMIRAVPTFFTGILIASVVRSGKLKVVPSWWSVHVLFAASILLLQLAIFREGSLILFAVMILMAALAERGGAASFMKTSFMTSLGQLSYGIYMVHVLASLPLLLILRRAHALDSFWASLAALAAFAISLALAMLSRRYFEGAAKNFITGAGWRRVPPMPAAQQP